MRLIIAQVPQGHASELLETARKHDAVNVSTFSGEGLSGPVDVAILNISNNKLSELIDDLQRFDQLSLSFPPRDVISLYPPQDEAADQVEEVGVRSPIEIFLAGLQSVGSWGAFLAYAAAAGTITWIGLFTNTVYLLTAAMLLAPFASPAMNTAIATASGDKTLLRQSLTRYFASIFVGFLASVVFSLIFGLDVVTHQMAARSQVSQVSFLLPVIAGAAGALNLTETDRKSLVSGAAVGVLVAASLAPPVGVAGMAVAMGRWDLAKSGLFLVLLQLAGINLTAAIVFRLRKLSARGVRYSRGTSVVPRIMWPVTLCIFGALLTWQLTGSPDLERASRSKHALSVVQKVVNEEGIVELVEAQVKFTRTETVGKPILLNVLYVKKKGGVDLTDEEIEERIGTLVQEELIQRNFNVDPVVSVNVLQG